jgi:hypothetical protein
VETKSRTIPTDIGQSTIVTFNSACRAGVSLKPGIKPVERTSYNYGVFKGTQVTESEGHPWKTRAKGSNLQDIGGDFFTQKTYADISCPNGSAEFDSFSNGFDWCSRQKWSGTVLPVHPGVFPPPSASNSSQSQLNQLGATAVALVKPDNPIPNMTVFLGEMMRDGLPKLPLSSWEGKTKDAMNVAAEDYLNLEFGFKPVAADIASFASAVVGAEKLLAQYERDAGRVVRRRFEFPSTETTESLIIAGNLGVPYLVPFDAGYFSTSGSRDLVRVRKTERRQWFSGAFTYYLPTGYDSRKEMASIASIAGRMLSLDLTPENIWNLAPWSWAVDWFSNAGDVLSNVTSFLNGSLVMRYGYLMEHTIITDTYSMRVPWILKSSGRTDGHLRLITETKVRRRANPFGFGVSWEGLSPRQLAIAAALGITRGNPQAR